jgi:hypothetical protein
VVLRDCRRDGRLVPCSGSHTRSFDRRAIRIIVPSAITRCSDQVLQVRPITITNANNTGRIWVNGVYTSLDEFRGTPYIQTDLRVTRPFKIGERWCQPVRGVLQHLQLATACGATAACWATRVSLAVTRITPGQTLRQNGNTARASALLKPSAATSARRIWGSIAERSFG